MFCSAITLFSPVVAAAPTVDSPPAVAESWSAPAPVGPFGGHFDFGLPTAEERAVEAAAAQTHPLAEYAIYRGDELPVINAAYEPAQPAPATLPGFSEAELSLIDPAWELGHGAEDGTATGLEMRDSAVWIMEEMGERARSVLQSEGRAVSTAQQQARLEPRGAPCVVPQSSEQRAISSSHTPFQEGMVDAFMSADLDMEQMAREADRLSWAEEERGQAAPVYFSNFIPDYALGVRRADVMDPLALTPQTRAPVRYFGFSR